MHMTNDIYGYAKSLDESGYVKSVAWSHVSMIFYRMKFVKHLHSTVGFNQDGKNWNESQALCHIYGHTDTPYEVGDAWTAGDIDMSAGTYECHRCEIK